MRLGLIGYGAIAKDICHYLKGNREIEIVSVLVLPSDLDQDASFPLVTDIDAFLASNPDLVAECAGHAAVDAFAGPVLEAGVDLMIISIGALADDALYEQVKTLVEKSDAQVFLPAGALVGVDGLGAARIAGLDEVCIQSTKPPQSWSGAPGVEGIDLEAIKESTVIFSGSAREAAQAFPKNANVAATSALAGIGMDRTQVELVADPETERNTHRLTFSGPAGDFEVVIRGNPSPLNPKTSQLTALNIVRAIETRTHSIVI